VGVEDEECVVEVEKELNGAEELSGEAAVAA